MAGEWTVSVAELTEEAFAPYGRIIRQPAMPATSSGAGWACWYGVQALEAQWPLHFGTVRTRYRPIVVEEMERHVHTFELLYPHDHALIQPVAPPGALDDPEARPDPATVKAFRIPVGAGIIMHAGTWHSPAFPEREDTTYTFACMEPDFASETLWVPLSDGSAVRVLSA